MVLRTKLLTFLLLSLCCLYFVGATDPDDSDYVTGIKEGDIEDDEDDIQSPVNAEEETVEEAVEEPTPAERALYVRPKVVGFAHFAEPFDNEEEFRKKWIMSQAKKEGAEEAIAKYDGKWELAEAETNALQSDLSLVLQSKAKHHAISSKLQRVFDFSGKPLIVQYEVKLQNGIECGGAYIKLLSKDNLDLALFHDKSPYTIMFGPDKCGLDYKLHFIFRHKNPKTGEITEKHAKKPTGSIEQYFTDKNTHLYQLVINPDNTFKITIDGYVVNEGNLLEDMTPPVNPPKEIEDKKDEKPKDWDDREKIPDPLATKPDDWDENEPEKIVDPDAEKPEGWLDDEPEDIPDPDAEKPSDWDDDMDGEWEAPLIANPKCKSAPGCGEWKPGMIDNPKYKGKWRPPMIDNPNYQGVWKPRMIPNPNFFEDLTPYKMMPIGAVGFELWSMTEGILFDNILITDNMATATKWTEDTFNLKMAQEKSSSSAKSVIQAILDVTNERPWLWAVFIVVVLLPIVLLIAYCCVGGGSKIRFLMDLPNQLGDYAEKHRWVYLIYLAIILGPVVGMSLYIMPKDDNTEDDVGERKKTDAPTPDDAEPKEDTKAPKSIKKKEEKSEGEEGEGEEEEEEGEEEEEEEEEKKEEEEEENKGKKEEIKESKSKKPSKGDLEAEKETENADVSAEEEEAPKVEKRRRARKE